jgi:predicted dehydrogenase
MKRYSVAVVGLGNVGLLYDIQGEPAGTVLTHCKAFSESDDFELVSGVDPDLTARRTLLNAYSVPAYDSLERMLEELHPDVVVVSCPAEHQIPAILQVLTEHKPKFILCEKPFGIGRVESQTAVSLALEKGVPLFVNYQRRADPRIARVREFLPDESTIAALTCVIWYSSDLRGGASHFIDLIRFFFPSFLHRLTETGAELEVYGSLEKNGVVSLRAGTLGLVLVPWTRSGTNHYSLEMVGDFGRLRYDHDGQLEVQIRDYRSPISLSGPRQITVTSPLSLQRDVARSVADFLGGERMDLCTGQEASDVQYLFDIIESRLGGGI